MELHGTHSPRSHRRRRRATTRVEMPPIAEPRVGDTVVAHDGAVGEIEDVIRTETRAPAYVVVSVRRFIGRRRPIVPWCLVAGVDPGQRRIRVRGRRRAISRLPETLPLVI